MLLVSYLTVEALIPEYKPTRAIVKPTARFLSRVQVIFPPGVLGSTKIRLLNSGLQFAPLEGWLTGNAETVEWEENKRLGDIPQIIIEGYSDAEDWPHTIQIRLFME